MTTKTNRDYLLTMLTTLQGKRAAAAGLKVLVQKKLINEDQVMQLLHTFLDIIYKTQSKVALGGLKKTIKK